MLEDVCLHQSLPALIWLVAAISKGYLVTREQIEWLLGLVEYMCGENYQDFTVHSGVQDFSQKDISKLITQIDNDPVLNDQQRDLLYSLLFRISYGGMKGDMKMFYYYVNNWIQRFTKGETISNQIINRVNPDHLGNLAVSDIEICCVDFHCFPQMIKYINEKHSQYSPEEIKLCIWACNSKTNTRNNVPISKKWITMWKQIKTDVRELQNRLITNHR
jgi:hypothetical protein